MAINEYMTIKEAAEKWGVTIRWVQELCAKHKVEGAVKFGKAWAIPRDTDKPADSRITTGQYKNWRRKDKEERNG